MAPDMHGSSSPSDVPRHEPAEVSLEMREGRPWWKMCFGSCLLLLAVGIGLVVWSGMGSAPQPVNAVPANFPAAITLYKPEAASITYRSNTAPFRALRGNPKTDIVVATWEALSDERDVVYRFYMDQFQRNAFAVETRRNGGANTDVITAQRDGTRVILSVTDAPNTPGIERMVATIEYIP